MLCVTPEHFSEHLEVLRKQYYPMQLQHLVQAMPSGMLPTATVVVTFDDGYVDNLNNAQPLLKRYDIPASVFVSSGYIGQERGFWWDELDRLFLQPRKLPETLCLTLSGRTFHWELREAARYNEDGYRRHRCWNVELKDDPSPRHRLYRSLCQLMRGLHYGEQQGVLDELRAWAGVEMKRCPTTHTLSSSEVRQLTEEGLIEIGSHSITHAVLSALSTDEQWSEILESKIRLEEILGVPVNSFAYPYGTRSDYTAETIAIVRQVGYSCACSNFPEVIRRGSDRFQLPRILVRDWDGNEFARRMGEWFCGPV